MNGNINECYLILQTGDSSQILIKNSLVKSSLYEDFLGVKYDQKLTLEQYFKGLYKQNTKKQTNKHTKKTKTSAKLKVLVGFIYYMRLTKQRKEIDFFFATKFKYCPLIWMIHSLLIKNRVKYLH